MEIILKEIVRDFPLTPGVYLMKDSSDKIIYVGKARNLRNRVRSYFTGTKDIKTRILVKNIASIDYILTTTEYEALLLENNLIKKWTPKYNIDLKDDKSYPSICVTKEDFPSIYKTRRVRKNGSTYYGPFTNVAKLESYINLIETRLPLRKCRGPLKKRSSPCLYYHIGRCSAPCCGKISKEAYHEYVVKAEKLLRGKTKGLVREMRKEMNEASKSLKFEKAAKMRDFIQAVEMVQDQTEKVEFDIEARDYVACYIDGTLCTFSVLLIRGGALSGKTLFRTSAYGDEEDAFTEFFLHQYEKGDQIPATIYVSGNFDRESVEMYLNTLTDKKTSVLLPQHGKHQKIIRMAVENAKQDVERRSRALENKEGLTELRQVLELTGIPRRIEGFDIAQLSGKYPVSSLVSFYNGIPDKKNYRRFHIKTLNGKVDDYEAIREVVARRYTRVINDNLDKPDLIVIDGGKGQVNAARGILDALGLLKIPVIGLAKKNEEIFFPGISAPLILPRTSEALRIIQAVRDETHRFATSFNKQLRNKVISLTELEEIPGIGVKRSRDLLVAFGSLDALSRATYMDIVQRTGLTEEAAENVESYLKVKKNLTNRE